LVKNACVVGVSFLAGAYRDLFGSDFFSLMPNLLRNLPPNLLSNLFADLLPNLPQNSIILKQIWLHISDFDADLRSDLEEDLKADLKADFRSDFEADLRSDFEAARKVPFLVKNACVVGGSFFAGAIGNLLDLTFFLWCQICSEICCKICLQIYFQICLQICVQICCQIVEFRCRSANRC